MAQTGILDYQRYLNTLQTLNDLGQTFPSNQQTYNFSVVGGTTASWTATISWETLILDTVSFSSQATGYIPNVNASQVIGYVEGSTTTQYSTGVISIPAHMYTGPILPGGDFNVPLTVVHLSWTNGTSTYAQQIGFIQNWEPGVEIGDPTNGFDYHPVYSLPSTLTLSGQSALLYGDNLTLTATSNIPLDLTGVKCRFYKKTGDVLLGEGTFSGSSANFTITTTGNFAVGTHQVYAVSPPYKNYLKKQSNDFTIIVADGIPLIVTTSTFTPSKSYYYVGETVTYNLGVIANPAFTATGVAIANTVTIKLVNVFSPYTETAVTTTNFVNGQTSNPFIIQSHMVDLARADSRTTYSITTSSYNTTTYTATLFVSNTETVISSWDSQYVGRYAGGSTSTLITVAGTATVTIQGNAFPITVTQDIDNSYLDDPFNITVTTPNVTYYNTITIYANKGATTLQLYSTNSNGTSTFVAPISTDFVTSGTWNIFASYPGDLGGSIVNANLPSTSNTLSHLKRNGYYLEPTPTLNLYRTPENDILQVAATTATTLTNIVTFYNTATILGTGTWVRSTGTNYSLLAEYNYYTSSGFARNFEVLKGPLQSTQGTVTTANRALYMSFYGALQYYVSNAPGGLADSYPRIPGPVPFNQGYYARGGTQSDPYLMGSMTPIGWAQPVRFPSTTDAQWAPWENYLASVATDPGKRLQGPFGANPNMTELNDVQGGFAWPKHPNKYSLFKYYDGTNYNLNAITGTNITEIADPIVFNTTWTVGPIVVNPSTGASGREAYRWDAIGDSRGYNVIALSTSTTTQRPLLNATTERLYFPGTGSTSTRYIDLVEFIGTATWQTQANSIANFPSGPTTSTISVWLYKFTPTIPQTNTQFKTNYPLLEAMELCEGRALDASKVHENWLNYGKKSWLSTNTNSAAANDLAAFYNDWFTAFTNPLGASIYVNKIGPDTNQNVTLYLPPNTISTTTGLHATWPGTQSLSRQYGKYYPFDIYKDPRPQAVNITNGIWNIDNQGSPFAQLTISSTGVVGYYYSDSSRGWLPIYGLIYPTIGVPVTNSIKIISTVTLADPAFSRTIISGRVELYDDYPDTPGAGWPSSFPRILSTATLINSTATFNIKGSDFSVLQAHTVYDYGRKFHTRFISDSTATSNTASTIMNIIAAVPAIGGPGFIPGFYNNLDYEPFVNGAISSTATINSPVPGNTYRAASGGYPPGARPIDEDTRISMSGNVITDFPFLATSTGTGKIFVEFYYKKRTFTGGIFGITPLTTSSWQPLILVNNGVAAGIYANNVYGIEQSNTATGKTPVLINVPIAYQEFGFQPPYAGGGEVAAFAYSLEIGFKSFTENAAIPKFAQIGLTHLLIIRDETPGYPLGWIA